MSVFRATVGIRGKEMEVILSQIEFNRKTDNKGRPVTSVLGGRVTFSIESTRDTDILEAMINSQFKPISGKITYYRTEDNAVFRTIEFRCAYIVYYREIFNVDKKRPLFTTITLSADSLIVGNAVLSNRW
ncbi:type VI secretion system tube protein TssD [Phocaeicola plebeius]|uniref:type VI secretion system tube protein TssD n=1 Tax=Phocaeicola plebeius TaxID=310297 RepID=UPI0019578A5F|nr:type VI secretion system tube protein TssD [Phocaeicola plebeius]MBM6845081.1 hypothetical protein [Phocaeicola plebeius]